jgi:hypothetical protein
METPKKVNGSPSRVPSFFLASKVQLTIDLFAENQSTSLWGASYDGILFRAVRAARDRP